MDKQDLSQLTDEEPLAAKKQLKQSRLFHTIGIGFLAGILLFGVIAFALSPEKQVGFLIPLAIPVVFIYRALKNPKQNTDLEEVLKARNLS